MTFRGQARIGEVPPAGLEPATAALGKRYSIHLSYGGVGIILPVAWNVVIGYGQ